MSILTMVVEDNPLNMKLVRTLLTLDGCDVIEFMNADGVVDNAVREQPDLILMDIQLPGISGLEACKLLKGDPRTARIPIVALTSYAMPGDEKKALTAGCAGYVTKPIDTQSFSADVRSYIRRP